ncbi:MAG: hypothetical protein D6800_13270 [Candidatus Zixiibacteriota bacterium]|nr:MAG: hypothetical protein D6800_13270 [candidate division Zixibacteria bacterium]
MPPQRIYLPLPRRTNVGNEGVDLRLRLLVDTEGMPRLYDNTDTVPPEIRPVLDSLLSATRFLPGSFDNQPVVQVIPFKILGFSGQHTLQLAFPVAADTTVKDPFLYGEALRLNEVEMPRIREFPSYFFQFLPDDSSKVYPYLLVRVTLDSTGRLVEAETIHNSARSFADQILTAVNWARFRPASVRGEATPVTTWLMISFFPEVSYPTSVLTAKDWSAAPLRERLRVHFLPDTTGLLMPPLPRYHQKGFIRLAKAKNRFYGTVHLPLAIDSNWVATLGRLRGRSDLLRRMCRELLSRERFYPALAADSRPVPFRGLIGMTFDGSENVRVAYSWLPRR